jgi:YidC/Oxa1 family membrane protein insertase
VTLEPLYHAVAFLIVHIHEGLAPIFGGDSGASWALSIVLLTVAMRLVLFPVFVKQIRTQRAMQAMQPKMTELRKKYKNDKAKLNEEMQALWKEAGANPLAGCLPLILQIPIFIALFHTLNKIKPSIHNGLPSYPSNVAGFPEHLIKSAAQAKIFGVPIAASFSSSSQVLHALSASRESTRILCLVLTVLMGATTFYTQRQLMARNTADPNSQMAQQQKILLYVFPVLFLFYGFKFPIGVLLYWLTTNVWSMVQQKVVIGRMDGGAKAPAAPVVAGPPPGSKPKPPKQAAPPTPVDTPAVAGPAPAAAPARTGGNGNAARKRQQPGNRRPNSRPKSNKRGRR